MPSTPQFTDGTLHEKEFSVYPEIEYPFAKNPEAPDVFARVFKRKFWVDPRRYLPRISNRTVYQNGLPYSDDLSHAAWTKNNVTVGFNAGQNPWDNLFSVDSLTETTANSTHTVYPVTSVTLFPSRTAFSCIVFANISAGRWLWLYAIDSAAATWHLFFDPVSKKVNVSGTGATYTVETLPRTVSDQRQAYRVTLFFTPAFGSGSCICGFSTDGATTSYAGSTSAFMLVAQLQLETAAVAGPLIISGSAAAGVICPEVDSVMNRAALVPDPFAFHVAESAPVYVTRRRAWVERTYARIPRQQIVPGDRFFTRPRLHDTKSGTAYGVGFLPDRDHIFTSRKTVSSIAALTASGSTTVDSSAVLDHTLITIEANNSVRTFYADDNDATIQAAMSNAILGDTTEASSLHFPILRNPGRITICATVQSGTRKLLALSSPSLTAPVSMEGSQALGVNYTIGELFSVGTQGNSSTTTETIDPSIRTVAATSHGGVVGDRVAFWANDAIYALGLLLTVPDANNFTVSLETLPGKDATVTHCAFSSDADLCVLNGPKSCSIRRVTDFYLPGYTEGIDSSADIAGQDPATDAVNWLTAIIAGTTWVNVDGSEISQYQGPILQREYAQVQLADAVQTVTP